MTLNRVLLFLYLSPFLSASVTLQQSDTIFTLLANTSYSISLNSSLNNVQYFQIYISQPSIATITIRPASTSQINLYLDLSTRFGYNLRPSLTSCIKSVTQQISTSSNNDFSITIGEPADLAIALEYSGINTFEIAVNLSDYDPPEKTSEVLVAVFLTISAVAVVLIILGALYYRKKRKSRKGTNESSTNPHHVSMQGNNLPIPQTEDILHQLNQNDMNVDNANESIHANNILVHDYQGSMTRMHNIDDDFDVTMPSIPNERSKREESAEMCVVCLVANKNILFEPCNHVAACQDCALKVLEIQSKCPLCREEIVSILPVA